MNITKEMMDNQRDITQRLYREKLKLDKRYNTENKLYRLMLDNYNASHVLAEYEAEYVKIFGNNTPPTSVRRA